MAHQPQRRRFAVRRRACRCWWQYKCTSSRLLAASDPPVPRVLVMTMQFLTVHEVHATDRAGPVLGFSKPQIKGGQVTDVDPPPVQPVIPETGVIR